MRAIIIDDKDARTLLDKLKLESCVVRNTWDGVPDHMFKDVCSQLHRQFHYVVTCWLQDQGARTT